MKEVQQISDSSLCVCVVYIQKETNEHQIQMDSPELYMTPEITLTLA